MAHAFTAQVAYTERQECICVISARRATQYEQDDYFKKNG
jgi:uncharacterized DUF497 family protein